MSREGRGGGARAERIDRARGEGKGWKRTYVIAGVVYEAQAAAVMESVLVGLSDEIVPTKASEPAEVIWGVAFWGW